MIRRGGAQAAVAVAFALLALAAPARGALDVPGVPNGPLRVALFSTTPDDPLAGRIEAELGTIGIDVARAVVSPGARIEAQVRAAIAGGARAVIVADGHRTDVWISDPGSTRIGLRQELEVDQDSGQQAVLALRTVEFLRISLGLVAEPAVPPPVRTRPAAVAPVVPEVPKPARWFDASASAGALAVTGGGGTIAIAGLSLRAQLAGMVGAELSAYAPLSEATLTTADGEAGTSAWMAGGGILLAPRFDQRISFEVAAGSLITIVRSRGVTAATTYPPGTDSVTRAAIYGRVAARLRLLPRLALRLDLYGGGIIRAPHIVVPATMQVATWGPGFAAGTGAAEVTF
ncbi:MAG TPA: hypothetical protein VGP64_01555 [Polyangia bacterium]